MKLLTKSLLILILAFTLRIIQSCGCQDDPHFFDFDQITVLNLDNSKDYPISSSTDTMYSSAVTFEISISDNKGYAYLRKGNFGFGFSEAVASECPIQFKSNQQISEITIITLEAISSEIPENTDITDLFLGLVPYNSSLTYLYEPIDKLYNKINQETYFDDTTAAFQIFSKVNIQNEIARFAIIIDLSDGRTLTGLTDLIHIIPSF
jgi:hypothetical protein